MSSSLQKEAKRLSDLTGMEVAPTAFDVGYWKRYAGEECPGYAAQRAGWLQCAAELQTMTKSELLEAALDGSEP